MNVGIITLHNSINYGAFLQAYALQKTIMKLGHQVEIIDLFNLKDKLSLIRKDVFSKNYKKMKFNYKLYKSFKDTNKNIVVKKCKKNNVSNYDVVFIGSDEMWNVKNLTFNHLPEYFGLNINAKTIATYAISCGQSSYDDLISNSQCVEGVKKINYFSGRDKNTVNIMKKLSGKSINYVLDPTLLYDFNKEEDINPTNQKYIVIYTNRFDQEYIVKIKEFAKERNLKLISPGFMNEWCDEIVSGSPMDFINLIKHSEYVITDTFHGAHFSVIFKKKFIIIGNNKIKVNDFLEQIELTNRIVSDPNELEKKLISEIDYNSVFNIINKKRELSIDYLKKVIS